MTRIVQDRVSLLDRLLGRTLQKLGGIAERRGRAPNLPPHLATGFAGEDAAFFYLRRKQYIVVARRWSAGDVPGDVDLIAWDGPMLCFVEVKTRTAHDMTPAETAVDAHKRRILRRLARRHARQLPQQTMPPVRFDVISIYLLPKAAPEITHFEAAFGWGEYERRAVEQLNPSRLRTLRARPSEWPRAATR